MKAPVYCLCMLNRQDKKWILETLTAGFKQERVITKKMVREEVGEAVEKQIKPFVHEEIDALARMVARSFDDVYAKIDACASRAQVDHMERNMVTKDYLDERLGIIKEKEDTVHKQLKIQNVLLIQELRNKKIIGPKRANTLASLPPFPQKI